MENVEPEWYDPNLPAPKVGQVLYGLERQRAIDNYMAWFIHERAGEYELVGLFVDYVNSYRLRRNVSTGRGRRKKTYTLERAREVHHSR